MSDDRHRVMRVCCPFCASVLWGSGSFEVWTTRDPGVSIVVVAEVDCNRVEVRVELRGAGPPTVVIRVSHQCPEIRRLAG